MSTDRISGLSRRQMLAGAGAAAAIAAVPFAPALAETAPLRVVSLDYGITTTLIELGRPPVGAASAAIWDRWVREPALPASVVDVGTDLVVNLELIARLAPDLILMTPYTASASQALARVAPIETVTLYAEGGQPLERALNATAWIAERIGIKEEGQRFIAAFEQKIVEAKARVAAINAPPLALINFMDVRHARVYGRNSLYQNVLDRVGLQNAWQGETNYWGFRTIGLEELARDARRDMELIIFEPIVDEVQPTLARSPLWHDLPVVRENRYAILPPVLMFGMLPSAKRFLDLVLAHLEAHYG